MGANVQAMGNADTYRKAVTVYNLAEGDWKAIKDHYHPDFRMTAVDAPEALTFDEMATVFAAVKSTVLVKDLIEYGDDVIARLDVNTSLKGVSATFEILQWVTYKDGLIIGAKGYSNTPTQQKEFFDSIA